MRPRWTGEGPIAGHAWVPIDDQHAWAYAFTWHPTRPLADEERAHMLARPDAMYSELIPDTYRPRRNRANDYAEPEWPLENYRMKRIRYFQDQDVAITESMGPLYDRTREHLGASDAVIIQTRKRLLAAARGLQKGDEPPCMDPADYRVRQLSVCLPRSVEAWWEAVAGHLTAYPGTVIPSAETDAMNRASRHRRSLSHAASSCRLTPGMGWTSLARIVQLSPRGDRRGRAHRGPTVLRGAGQGRLADGLRARLPRRPPVLAVPDGALLRVV